MITTVCFISEGQPESIVADIENMVRSYVEKVCLLLFEQFFCANKRKGLSCFVMENVDIDIGRRCIPLICPVVVFHSYDLPLPLFSLFSSALFSFEK